MSIDVLQAHYGFSRTPFGRDLAPGMLHRSAGHGEAVARIDWCIAERALGVITGEVGSGKTVATRAATAALDASRHSVIYLGNPAIGARGLYASIVSALGGVPGSTRRRSSPRPPTPWPPRRTSAASGWWSWWTHADLGIMPTVPVDPGDQRCRRWAAPAEPVGELGIIAVLS